MPGGRPTKYKERYCKDIVEFLATGASVTEFAAHINVHRDSIYEWADKHKTFSDALSRGASLSQAYWEKRMREDLIVNPKANAPLIKLYLANRFGWSDKKETTHKGEAKSPLQIIVHES